MIKLFAFLLLRNTTITMPVLKPCLNKDKGPLKGPSKSFNDKSPWTIIDKNRNTPWTINVKPLFSPDGEEYNIGVFKDILPL